MKQKILILTSFCFFSFLTIDLLAQETITITASKNNTLYESAGGSLSNARGDHIFAGLTNNDDIRRALLFFDLSDIPEDAQIENVELQLVMNKSVAGDTPVSLHEILQTWGEGNSNAGGEEGGGTNATDGDATWVHTFFPDDTWNNEGGDFDGSGLVSIDVGGTGTYTWPSTQELVDLVQKWLDEPSENNGLMVRGDESGGRSAKRFSSRHNPSEEDRPVLIVEFSGETTSGEIMAEIPDRVKLDQNYPNPFNPQTVISYSLPSVTIVEIAVHDLLGRKIETLVNERVQAGTHEIMFDASDLSSGVYIYTLRTDEQSLSRKLTVVK